MHRLRATHLAGVLLCALAVPGLAAHEEEVSPQNVRGTYHATSHSITLHWDAPAEGNWTYKVYRDSRLVGETQVLTFRDSGIGNDKGYVYFVTATLDGQHWSMPGIGAVPTLTCQVVTLTTSWEWPHAYVKLHEECLGGIVYDKSVTWTAPQ